ncbi:hypothetical protein H5410_004970 [Solanum commersonii]|uniref:Uncharacterized protein n=1 Tax=Solanum commersonii TaxID=4109 RepID=A0A9J6A5W0_SOLCO|nr:hypothetical protein H5410_004970 [Solanum commersonii]
MNAHKRFNLPMQCSTMHYKFQTVTSIHQIELKLTMLASNANSSSTKTFEFPCNKNDSIHTKSSSKFQN